MEGAAAIYRFGAAKRRPGLDRIEIHAIIWEGASGVIEHVLAERRAIGTLMGDYRR